MPLEREHSPTLSIPLTATCQWGMEGKPKPEMWKTIQAQDTARSTSEERNLSPEYQMVTMKIPLSSNNINSEVEQ